MSKLQTAKISQDPSFNEHDLKMSMKQGYCKMVSLCCINVLTNVLNILYLFTIYTFLCKVCEVR